MRNAVMEQVLEVRDEYFARKNNSKICPITQKILTPDNTHIDHEYPTTFQWLVDNFLESNGIGFNQIGLNEPSDGFASVIQDPKLLAQWQSYHRQNAILRAVHRDANLGILKTNPSKQLTKV